MNIMYVYKQTYRRVVGHITPWRVFIYSFMKFGDDPLQMLQPFRACALRMRGGMTRGRGGRAGHARA